MISYKNTYFSTFIFLLLALAFSSSLNSVYTKNDVCKSPNKTKKLKLVSLAPSNTELIYSIHAEDQLISVCNACNYPEQAKSKPIVGNFSNLNIEKLLTLSPDLVLLVNGQESVAHTLKAHNIKYLVLNNSSISHITSNLKKLGELTGHQKEAEVLANKVSLSIKELRELSYRSKTHPLIFFCVWGSPILSVGKNSYLNEVLEICGAINCTKDYEQAYPRINPEKLLTLNPDYIIVPSEAAKTPFWDKQPWIMLNAVKQKKIIFIPADINDCLSRPTFRLLKGLTWLTKVLHPETSKEISRIMQ